MFLKTWCTLRLIRERNGSIEGEWTSSSSLKEITCNARLCDKSVFFFSKVKKNDWMNCVRANYQTVKMIHAWIKTGDIDIRICYVLLRINCHRHTQEMTPYQTCQLISFHSLHHPSSMMMMIVDIDGWTLFFYYWLFELWFAFGSARMHLNFDIVKSRVYPEKKCLSHLETIIMI